MPNIYPSPPQSFVLGWENEVTLEQVPVIDRRNGGVELRGNAFQINTARETQQVSVNITGLNAYLEITDFLTQRQGSPFIFNSKIWEVKEWSWSYLGGSGVRILYSY
ncbi:hypothetical protein [Nostoc sp. PCC 7107]|uniref:hypothetical protein n=1 Tax=Nostoc sp. PCC 7107 TaxID=317936 RepID=UPI00029F4031|nr:hypothetical protein [Nostoc sp. PCC 7107]AFY45465.1 hypothetical protein Nos7107_4947 [Nostoc sp. PCC 7107]